MSREPGSGGVAGTLAGGGGEKVRGRRVTAWRRYYQSDGAAVQDLPGYEVERPVGKVTVAGQFIVPLLQATVIGITAGLLSTWCLADLLEVVDGWWPAAGVLILAAFGLAFASRMSASESTLWTVERVIGRDITGDDVIGDPQAHIVTITGPGASTSTPEERKRAKFVGFVRAVEASGDGGYERWEPVLGRDRYLEFRDALLRCGLATWRDPDNHRLGWELTRSAEQIVKAVM